MMEKGGGILSSTIARQMIATLQKSEGSLWHTQELHFNDLGTKAIILSFSTIKRLYGEIRG